MPPFKKKKNFTYVSVYGPCAPRLVSHSYLLRPVKDLWIRPVGIAKYLNSRRFSTLVIDLLDLKCTHTVEMVRESRPCSLVVDISVVLSYVQQQRRTRPTILDNVGKRHRARGGFDIGDSQLERFVEIKQDVPVGGPMSVQDLTDLQIIFFQTLTRVVQSVALKAFFFFFGLP